MIPPARTNMTRTEIMRAQQAVMDIEMERVELDEQRTRWVANYVRHLEYQLSKMEPAKCI